MLQAVRGCIKGAGAKMGVKIRKEITQTLEGLLSCNEDTTRTTAAACLGTLCAFMTDAELSLTLNLHFLGWYTHTHTHTIMHMYTPLHTHTHTHTRAHIRTHTCTQDRINRLIWEMFWIDTVGSLEPYNGSC